LDGRLLESCEVSRQSGPVHLHVYRVELGCSCASVSAPRTIEAPRPVISVVIPWDKLADRRYWRLGSAISLPKHLFNNPAKPRGPVHQLDRLARAHLPTLTDLRDAGPAIGVSRDPGIPPPHRYPSILDDEVYLTFFTRLE